MKITITKAESETLAKAVYAAASHYYTLSDQAINRGQTVAYRTLCSELGALQKNLKRHRGPQTGGLVQTRIENIRFDDNRRPTFDVIIELDAAAAHVFVAIHEATKDGRYYSNVEPVLGKILKALP